MLDPLPVEAELQQKCFRMFRGLRCARGLQRLVVELNGPTNHLEWWTAITRLNLADHIVGKRLLVLREVEKTLERRPLTLHRFEVLAPVRERLLCECRNHQV